MRKANTAIKRERHITPTIDDIISKLNGAQVFSKLDMNKEICKNTLEILGYFQLMQAYGDI